MVVSMGAVRPVQVDGVRGLARVVGGTTIEAFGGFPVVRRFDHASFDWMAGGRVGQSIGEVTAFPVETQVASVARSAASTKPA